MRSWGVSEGLASVYTGRAVKLNRNALPVRRIDPIAVPAARQRTAAQDHADRAALDEMTIGAHRSR